MYIGPWQEYRLAKIQDDVIQQLEKQFNDQQQRKDKQDPDRNSIKR
jgi:hypothetical protein